MKIKELLEQRIYNTDKFTSHQYLNTYEELFEPIQHNVKNLLEVGVLRGESLELWKNLFTNAEIYGAELVSSEVTIKQQERIEIFYGDAYNKDFLNNFKDIKFDIIIDDGSHQFEHMDFFCKYYKDLLNINGIIIVEDIPAMDWAEKLKKSLNFKDSFIVDLRHLNNRWDDIMLIGKNN
ncbi:MAG TPA: hypothetical protein PKD00_00175 [Burkholderiales bacterium]|nr:hypothetical protein [Burkholderiales bacterium]